MAWGLVLAGISAASGAFNAYDEYHSNREIRSKLDKIQSYLVGLNSAVTHAIVQNQKILRRLDQLPLEIRQIVQEVVDTALLTERYSAVNDLRDNFLILRGGRVYGIRSSEWLRFSGAMGYLFDHEYRLSKIFDLIKVCEIALIITKERALPLVIDRVKAKIEAIQLLFNDLEQFIKKVLIALKEDLDNKTYVTSHNLSPDLGSFDDFEFQMQPDRTTTQHYTAQECHTEYRGRYDRPVKVCRDIRRSRQVPDTAFHNARNAYKTSIENQFESIKLRLLDLGHLKAVTLSLEKYLSRISDKKLMAKLGSAPSMYFNGSVEFTGLTAKKIHTLPPVDEEDLDDYLDGCHGHCEEVKSELIQENSLMFFSEHC